MAVLVSLDAVTVARGTRLLLDRVSLGVGDAERIGVVGRNGGGKTTLLRTLVKAEDPDAGRVTHTGGLQVGVLAQDVQVDEQLTARRAVVGDAAEHTWAGDARVREILDGLGLHELGLDSPVGNCPAASGAGSPSPPCWCRSSTCSSSTSRPTTSTSRAWPGWPGT